jgi:hypothetical protein
VNDRDLDDLMAAIGRYWPAPPAWDDERIAAYRTVLGPLRVEAAGDALYQLATTEARRICPAPAEFLALAREAEARRRREAGERRAALASGTDAPPPTRWRTADRDCRLCGGRLQLVMNGPADARLWCEPCNAIEVRELSPVESGRRAGEWVERVRLDDAERHALRTVAADAWDSEQVDAFKARVRAAASGRPRGAGGLRSVGDALGGVFPRHEGRAALWQRARMLERRGLAVDWGRLAGDGCLSVAEGHAYLADAWDAAT